MRSLVAGARGTFLVPLDPDCETRMTCVSRRRDNPNEGQWRSSASGVRERRTAISHHVLKRDWAARPDLDVEAT